MAVCAADLTDCSLCLEEFQDPRALPCLHTFCLNCLVQLIGTNQNQATVKCPMCKEEHRIPQNGAEGFRKDFRMKSLMEMNKKEEFQVKVTMCPRHPMSELTHYCQETVCKQAVLCTHCIMENHQNHQVLPIKGFCEARLCHLKVMKQAIGQNHQLLQTTRNKVEENRCDTVNEVKRQMEKYHATLYQLEKKILAGVNSKAMSSQCKLTIGEDNLHEAENQLKALEGELTGTIPNIVQANVDKHLDRNFNRLRETLSNWSLKYRLLQTGTDVLNLSQFVDERMNNDAVMELPEQGLKGSPIHVFNSKVSPVEAKEIMTWQKRDVDVLSIACHSYGGAGVTILSLSHLRVYKQNEGKMFHSSEDRDEGYRITTFGEGCHAVAYPTHSEIRLYYKWPIFLEKVSCVIPVPGVDGCGVSGTQNYLVYSGLMDSFSRIACFSVSHKPPKCLWQWDTELVSPRSLSALETPTHLLVVVSCRSGLITQKNDTALLALIKKKSVWHITFGTLDREAERFDLRDMCNDGRYFYVLNTEESCVYMVSSDGDVLSKILQNLQLPLAIACNSETKDLVVACEDKRVTVYKLFYKVQ